MLITIAIIVVVVLLAVALLPMKKREPEQLRQASPVAFLTPRTFAARSSNDASSTAAG